MQPKTKGEGDEKAEEVETEIPFMKGYAVFNAEQIDGLPAHFYATVAAITGKGAGFRSLNDT